MNNQHQLFMSPINYPGGLRIIECQECAYAFAAEIDEIGVIKMPTKVAINQGDLTASHSYFQTPEIKLELSVSSDAEPSTKR